MSFSRWMLADLQVHTPDDKYHRYGHVPGEYPSMAFAEELVGRHAEAGVRIMAVTDHNRVDWWPVLCQAGVRHDVYVFPGVEINVNKCHLLFIWDRTQAGYGLAQRFVATLFNAGIAAFLDDGQPRPVVSGSPLDLIERAVEMEALPFAPHSTKGGIGLFGKNVCNTSATVAQSGLVSGFDVYGNPGADVLRNPKCEFGEVAPAWFISGDVRAFEDVGLRAVYLKVSDHPTLESIRQAFLMPSTRIRFPASLRNEWAAVKSIDFLDKVMPSWPHIERIRIEGGFHAGLDVSFGPGLNAIIGGKGTGKSEPFR